MNFKFHCKNYKGALAATIQLSHGLHRQPPGFLEILTRGPRPWSERRHGVDRPKPARGSPAARVEGCGRFTAPVRTCRCPVSRSGWAVVAARREQAVGGGGNSTARLLRRVLGEEEGWVSFVGSRRSCWCGQRGRWSCGATGSTTDRRRRSSGNGGEWAPVENWLTGSGRLAA